MKIWVYSLAYNEGPFVRHFLAGYKQAERIVVFDNMSTDDTVSLLLKDSRVEVRQYDSDNKIRDDYYLDIKDNAWKEARGKADWVIVVDFDEIFNRVQTDRQGFPIFDLNLDYADSQGFNIIKPLGYNMISLDAPLYAEGHPYLYSNNATYHAPEEKLCCFKPDEIEEMRYHIGCHGADPLDRNGGTQGLKVCMYPEYKLLHFKFWNLETYMKRMAEYQTRLSEWNIGRGAGWHYRQSLDYHRNLVINGSKLAVPLLECKKPE